MFNSDLPLRRSQSCTRFIQLQQNYKNPQQATRRLTVDTEFVRLIQTSAALFDGRHEIVAQILN
jgi:hypothetical protein